MQSKKKKKWTAADQARLEQRLSTTGYTKADATKARTATAKYKGGDSGVSARATTQSKLSFIPTVMKKPAAVVAKTAVAQKAPRAPPPVFSAKAAAKAPAGPLDAFLS
jgi:hypothetical protein